MSNKRSTRRASLVAKIEAQAGGFPFIAIAENISEGGMLVRTADPLDEGAVVQLRFTLPDSERQVTVNATVRHVVPGASMGVQFEGLKAADFEAIREYVEAG